MKKLFLYMGIGLFAFASCKSPINTLDDPKSEAEYFVKRKADNSEEVITITNPEFVYAKEKVTFTTTDDTQGDKFILYTDEEGNKFVGEDNPENGTSFNMNKVGDYYQVVHEFTAVGQYTPVILTTSYNKFIEDPKENIKRATQEFSFEVRDITAELSLFMAVDGSKRKKAEFISSVDGQLDTLLFSGLKDQDYRIDFQAGNSKVTAPKSTASAFVPTSGDPIELTFEGDQVVLVHQKVTLNPVAEDNMVITVTANDADPATGEKRVKRYLVVVE